MQTLLLVVTLAVTDPVGAVLLLVVEALCDQWSVRLIVISAKKQTTYMLEVAVVTIEGGGMGLGNGHGVGSSNLSGVAGLQTANKNVLDGITKLRGEVLLIQDPEQQIVQFTEVFLASSVASSWGKAIDDPRLSTRNSHAAAGHALGFAGSQGARNTTDRDVSGQLIHGDQRGESPIGTRAEERGTRLAAHVEYSEDVPILVNGV